MKILVVDDDLSSRLLAQAAVESLGHSCVTATDGEEAWELFCKERPDVLVTDREMPRMDGVQLCKTIRKEERDSSYTYIVLVTSAGEDDDVRSGMEGGADDYLTKPLDLFALETRLMAARRVTTLHAQLAHFRTELAELARTDPLTKLRNRLTLGHDLDLLHSRSRRYKRSYSLALCDVDVFKLYNDTYGHQAGDQALRGVALALDRHARQGDAVYRYGGEEFLVVLPEQAPADALAAVDRLREAVKALGIEHAASPGGVLTVSAGVASFVAGRDVSAEEILKEADLALYQAKAAGRDRVVAVAEPAVDPLVYSPG
jgi:diguanylate cyclase (GGDEF)-like protein